MTTRILDWNRIMRPNVYTRINTAEELYDLLAIGTPYGLRWRTGAPLATPKAKTLNELRYCLGSANTAYVNICRGTYTCHNDLSPTEYTITESYTLQANKGGG